MSGISKQFTSSDKLIEVKNIKALNYFVPSDKFKHEFLKPEN